MGIVAAHCYSRPTSRSKKEENIQSSTATIRKARAYRNGRSVLGRYSPLRRANANQNPSLSIVCRVA